MTGGMLSKNLRLIAGRRPGLYNRIAGLQPSSRIKSQVSRSGHPIPVLMREGGIRALHSTMDPMREGERFFSVNAAPGFLVFFGLGAGYHIEPFLARNDISSLMIVEPEIEDFISYLSIRDLSLLIEDPRVEFVVGQSAAMSADSILFEYLPAVSGNLKVIPFHALAETHGTFYQDLSLALKNLLSHLATDYTVQSCFGKRWFANAVRNIPIHAESPWLLTPVRKALITGAGPSLEAHIDTIKTERRDGFLIATDTSLPALMGKGIAPDAVLSIDCQHISYRHFIGELPEDARLVLELSSPPTLARRTKRLCFFASPNPFARYVSGHFKGMPVLDTSGGNVSHTAISLASELGAEEILLFGMDFSYPEGKTYARGTYVYSTFALSETRLASMESLAFSFLLRSPQTERTKTDSGFRYETPQLSGYKSRLERFLCGIDAEIRPAPGKGLRINVPIRKKGMGKPKSMMDFSAPTMKPEGFLSGLREIIESLPPPDPSITRYLSMLSEGEREVVLTLLPVCAYIREHDREEYPLAAILSPAAQWAVSLLRGQG